MGSTNEERLRSVRERGDVDAASASAKGEQCSHS